MINAASGASVYTDFQGLAELRAAAARHSPEAMRETARQFEALFVQSMLKAMRDASQGEGLFDSDQTDLYRDLHDRQLALEMVRGRGLGIADMLVNSMGGGAPARDKPLQQDIRRTGLPPVPRPPDTDTRPLLPVDGAARPVIATAPGPARPLVDLAAGGSAEEERRSMADWRPANPETFIRELLPHARRGAAALGVRPEVLVAQAALETGWGKKMIRHPDGRNSFNLFGIKADARWSGDRATVSTLEYEHGIATRQQAAFRSYSSLGAAVDGYVEFLKSNPRYLHALENTDDSQAYLQGLKDAGYATDPYYVEKIRSILGGEYFDRVTDRLALNGRG